MLIKVSFWIFLVKKILTYLLTHIHSYDNIVSFLICFVRCDLLVRYNTIPSSVRLFINMVMIAIMMLLSYIYCGASVWFDKIITAVNAFDVLMVTLITTYASYSFLLAYVKVQKGDQKNPQCLSKTSLVFRMFIKILIIYALVFFVCFTLIMMYTLIGFEFFQSFSPLEDFHTRVEHHINKSNIDTAVNTIETIEPSNTLVNENGLTPDEQRWFDDWATFINQGFDVFHKYINIIFDYINPFVQFLTHCFRGPIMLFFWLLTPVLDIFYYSCGFVFVDLFVRYPTDTLQFVIILIITFSMYPHIHAHYESTRVADVERRVNELYKNSSYARKEEYHYLLIKRLDALRESHKRNDE